MQQRDSKSREKWARFSISSLEADVAYFDARLALLNKKNATYHQLAQVKAYTELERVLSRMLARLKGGDSQTGSETGIEVTETTDDAEASELDLADKPVDKIPADDS
ncbi:MAG: hypothetical protein OQL28_04080 [Sedimenticola sp.]|nr:hypothetical protein [Sedimenticola sp.]